MPIKVLVVDDSAFIRQLLTELLEGDPDIKVVGTAADPHIAREKIKALNPDVVTLDIEMPRMDGLTFLERLMALRPTPVIVISTLTQKGTEIALRALEMGAVDVVAKPTLDVRQGFAALQAELAGKVRAASLARPKRREAAPVRNALAVDPRLSSEGRIVAVGASTGGVEALQRLLADLPANTPSILITQHMPPGFTSAFAKRLNGICRMSICEAENGQRILPGHAYIAPGGQHLELAQSGAQHVCRLHGGPPVSGHRPSVDVLFHSVAAKAGSNATGIILTGMGRDGADGLLAMRRAGAATFGENEASCLVYGMPKAAREAGAVETELPLDRLAAQIVK